MAAVGWAFASLLGIGRVLVSAPGPVQTVVGWLVMRRRGSLPVDHQSTGAIIYSGNLAQGARYGCGAGHRRGFRGGRGCVWLDIAGHLQGRLLPRTAPGAAGMRPFEIARPDPYLVLRPLVQSGQFQGRSCRVAVAGLGCP